MEKYFRKVKYYETDKMGITHHSNYIRWMEEARMDFLNKIGYGMKRLEESGVTSPVVSLSAQYKHTTTFDDELVIETKAEAYTGARLTFGYIMTNSQTGAVVFEGKSSHCFIDEKGVPIAVKRRFPEFDAALKNEIFK